MHPFLAVLSRLQSLRARTYSGRIAGDSGFESTEGEVEPGTIDGGQKIRLFSIERHCTILGNDLP